MLSVYSGMILSKSMIKVGRGERAVLRHWVKITGAKYSVYEKSSDIRTCPTYYTLCTTFAPKTSDIMSDENV